MENTTTEVARIQRPEGPPRQVGNIGYSARIQHLPPLSIAELTHCHDSPPYYLEIAQSPSDGRANIGKTKGNNNLQAHYFF